MPNAKYVKFQSGTTTAYEALNNKDANSIISDIQANKEAIDKLVGTGDGSVSNDINNAIIEVKGVGYTKGTLKSHEDSITELYNKIAALEEKINTQETT